MHVRHEEAAGFAAGAEAMVTHNLTACAGSCGFIVKDADGQALACAYFEDEPQRQMSMKRLTRDEAFFVAVNIAKLPSVPRTILKDIPRPPHSASDE